MAFINSFFISRMHVKARHGGAYQQSAMQEA
jgi:hypothetical protein